MTYPLLLPNSITFLTCETFPESIMDLFLQPQRGKNIKMIFSCPLPICLDKAGGRWGSLVHEINHVSLLFIKPSPEWDDVQEHPLLWYYFWWQMLLHLSLFNKILEHSDAIFSSLWREEKNKNKNTAKRVLKKISPDFDQDQFVSVSLIFWY